MTRAGQGDVTLPPACEAALLVSHMHGVGFYQQGMAGRDPITPTTLKDWADGTSTTLGPIDFQDMLDASRTYVAACREYDGKPCFAPWEPNMTAEQEARIIAEQERMMDRLMGSG